MSILGRLVGGAVFITCVIIYFSWGSIVSLTADATDKNASLWLYDSDAVRGGKIEARIRVDGGDRIRIKTVTIELGDHKQRVRGTAPGWGNTIRTGGLDEASDTLDFEIDVPDVAEPDHLPLHIWVDIDSASGIGTMAWENDHQVEFTRDVATFTATTSLLRRIGRGAFCLGLAAAVVFGLIGGRRWYARREKTPSGAWVLAVLPYGALGYFLFAQQLSSATHLHGMPIMIGFMVAWFAVLAVAGALMSRVGLAHYTVTPALIPTEGGEAYRSADVASVVKSALDLEGAWLAAGLMVHRKKHHFIVTVKGWAPAYVPVPASEAFGDGAWEIRSGDRNTVMKVVEAARHLLGPLVCHSDRGGDPMKF